MPIIKNIPTDWSRFLLIRLISGTLLFLAYSSNAQEKTPNGGFAASAASQTAARSDASTAASVSSVILSPATVVGGNSTRLRVVLNQAAPVGGIQVTLHSANPGVVVTPATLNIDRGYMGASVKLNTVAVTSGQSVILTASYNGSTAGASLTVNPSKAAAFTLKLQPASLSVDPGSSGSDQAVTTAESEFDNSLTLEASNSPAGVSVSFTPNVIAAPGTGTSQVNVSVDSNVAPGKYPIKITASDGSITRAATLTLTVGNGSSSGAVGTLIGCVRNANGHKYQAVEFTMNEAATVDFNGNLYFGATCDPSKQADEFGYGVALNLGGPSYMYWFTDFADQLNTSAIWTVGNQTSQCVDYTVAPACEF